MSNAKESLLKVLLQRIVYLNPFLCLLSFKSVKGSETPSKAENTTWRLIEIVKRNHPFKAKRVTMTPICAVEVMTAIVKVQRANSQR